MFRIIRSVLLLAALILPMALPINAAASGASAVFPSFSIQSVSSDKSVTIQTFNFPAGDTFNVLMGPMGSRGIGGIWSAVLSSGSGGSLTATFAIPAALRGRQQIAIRLQSISGTGYYAYNWFYNNTTGSNWNGDSIPPASQPVYYPTFSISAVQRDSSVTIRAKNLPAGDRFRVLMGPMGTQGINGYQVSSFNSGSGGSQTLTFVIPAPLYGSHRISIRIESVTGSGYFAYNWFYNNTAY